MFLLQKIIGNRPVERYRKKLARQAPGVRRMIPIPSAWLEIRLQG